RMHDGHADDGAGMEPREPASPYARGAEDVERYSAGPWSPQSLCDPDGPVFASPYRHEDTPERYAARLVSRRTVHAGSKGVRRPEQDWRPGQGEHRAPRPAPALALPPGRDYAPGPD